MMVRSNEPIRVETNDGWIVVLQQRPWSDMYELWIAHKSLNGVECASVGDNGHLVMKLLTEGEEGQPTLLIPGTAWEGLATALRGVTPQIDKKEVDAELKATKYHLEDMRKLAKVI